MCIREFSIGLIFCAVLTSAASAQQTPNTIVASGTAEVLAKPDVANVDIGVVTRAPTTAPALRANSAEMNRVVAAIQAAGIPETDIQTSNFSIDAVHPTDQHGNTDESRTTGYEVTNKITVTVTDLSKVGAVIDAAVDAGANSSNSVSFDLKNRAAIDDQVLADAIRNARHNAEVMASAENAKVGKMISATFLGGDARVMAGGAVNQIEVTAARMSVLPGRIEVDANVVVTFVIE
jgi:uncharacterized protein